MVIYGQMRMLYARSNRLARLFYTCSRNVLIELGRNVCVFVILVICEYIITRHHHSSALEFIIERYISIVYYYYYYYYLKTNYSVYRLAS